MIGNPALRLLALTRQYKFGLVLSAVLGCASSTMVGLMTPKIYESQAIIKIDTGKKQKSLSSAADLMDAGNDDANALRDASLLLTSKEVLEASVKTLLKEGLDYDAAFPHRIRFADYRYYFDRLVKAIKVRLGRSHLSEEGPKVYLTPETDIESASRMLRNEMRFFMDPDAMTLTVFTQASAARTANRMCEVISQHFTEISRKRDLAALTNEEKYLTDSLDVEKKAIDEIDGALGDLRKKHPDIAKGASEIPGAGSVYALKFLERREELAKIDDDLKLDTELIHNYKEAMASIDRDEEAKRTALAKRLETDLTEIEFKRLEYTRVLGYSADHPEIKALVERSERLKGIASALKPASVRDGLTTEEMARQVQLLSDKMNMLRTKRRQIERTVGIAEGAMHKGLLVESKAASLLRDLGAHLDISKELRRHLEEVRIQIVGFTESATIIAPPILPTIPITLSVARRAIFGIVIGAATLLSLLFAIDIMNPRLLLFDDFAALSVKHFGAFKFHRDAMLEFVSCLLTMRIEEPNATSKRGQVVLFTRVTVEFNMEAWISEVAQILHVSGGGACVVVIERPSGARSRRRSARVAEVEAIWMHSDEIPFVFETIIERLRSSYSWILVLSEEIDSGPPTIFMMRSADRIFYLTKLGFSYLKDIERIQKSTPHVKEIDQYALVI